MLLLAERIPMQAVGYVRVSTDEQGASGLGLDAQRTAIRQAVEDRGWVLIGIHQDVASGRSSNGRPGLEAALAAVEGGDAGALVVAKLDRLSRSLKDLGGYLERAASKGWALVVLDPGVDTSTPHGEAMAGIAGVFARLEARLISQRTKEALAVARARGVRLGRPPADAPHLRVVRRRAKLMRRRGGRSLARIAEQFNAEGVPTPTGDGRWHPMTVGRLVATERDRSRDRRVRRPEQGEERG
jgi:DNA invertase Pin-like site-specific DNA recombinase